MAELESYRVQEWRRRIRNGDIDLSDPDTFKADALAEDDAELLLFLITQGVSFDQNDFFKALDNIRPRLKAARLLLTVNPAGDWKHKAFAEFANRPSILQRAESLKFLADEGALADVESIFRIVDAVKRGLEMEAKSKITREEVTSLQMVLTEVGGRGPVPNMGMTELMENLWKNRSSFIVTDTPGKNLFSVLGYLWRHGISLAKMVSEEDYWELYDGTPGGILATIGRQTNFEKHLEEYFEAIDQTKIVSELQSKIGSEMFGIAMIARRDPKFPRELVGEIAVSSLFLIDGSRMQPQEWKELVKNERNWLNQIIKTKKVREKKKIKRQKRLGILPDEESEGIPPDEESEDDSTSSEDDDDSTSSEDDDDAFTCIIT